MQFFSRKYIFSYLYKLLCKKQIAASYSLSWEQRKLGELCNITTGKLDANAMVSDGQYDFYTSGIDVFKIDVAAFEGPAITIAGNGASVGYMHLADGKFNAYQRTYVLTDFLADRQFHQICVFIYGYINDFSGCFVNIRSNVPFETLYFCSF